MATFSAIHRILRDNGVIIVTTSELGKKAYKSEVKNWNIPDHLHFAGPNTFHSIASKLGLRISYISRLLTQKVTLVEKLYYDSGQPFVQMIKLLLRHVPGLLEFSAVTRCLIYGYFYPRHEVVVLFQKAI
jgi:hypothetical protein